MNAHGDHPEQDVSEELSRLINTREETQQRISELVGSEVDTVFTPSGSVYMLLEAQEKLRQNEARLRESESNYRNLFQNNPQPMWVYERETLRFLAVNDAAVEHYGYSEEEFLGMTLLDLRPEEDVAALRSFLAQRGEGFHHAGILRHQLKGGTTIRVESSCHTLDFQGRRADLVLAEDVTKRVETEKSLIASEERLRLALRAANQGLYDLNVQTGEAIVSPEYALMIGHDPATFRETNAAWKGRLHPDDQKRVYQVYEEYLAGLRDEYRVEFRQRTKSGGWLWTLSLGMLVARDQEGRPLRMLGTHTDISSMKHAEELLRLQAASLEAAANGIVITDIAGKVIWSNPAFEQLTGYSREETHGRNTGELLRSGQQDAAFYKSMWETILSGKVWQGELINRRKDGSLYSEDMTITPVRDATGEIAHFVAIKQDISGKQAAEEALRERNALLSTAQRIGNMGSWDMDLRTNRLYWPEETCNLFGVDPAQFPGTFEAFHDLILPEDRQNLEDMDARARAADGLHVAEYRIRRPDGAVRWMYERGKITFTKAGQPVRRLGMVTDITDRKAFELRLAEQAALLDKASDAIIVRDLDNRVLYWNRRAEVLYGWTAAEALGRSVAELMYADVEFLQATTEIVMQQGEWSGELEHQTRQGDPVTVLSRWTLLRDSAGQPQSILAIKTDISEHKRMEQQILRTQRMESIGTLASGIAHDLNNMLAPILMSIELLKEQSASEDSRSLIETLRSSAQRGADLVRQILGIARGQEGKRIPLHPGKVVREIHRIVSETFPRNIAFALHLPEDIWYIQVDPTQLHQVIMNLCVNARDAMPEGGRLTLALKNQVLDDEFTGMNAQSRPGPHVAIQVEDTGMGIPKELQEKIFDPFFTTKELDKGTGLGLSTTFTIVKNHGGFINLYSEPGKGAKFKVYLPAMTTPGAAEEFATTQTRLPRGHGELILLVDDEENVRTITSKALESFGYRVMLACNGAEGVALFARHIDEIALVLTDMSMPIMDGPAMIVALKAFDPQARIIGSSGLLSNGQVLKAIGAGVEHFVPKPYTAEVLLTTIHTLLNRDNPDPAAAPETATTAPAPQPLATGTATAAILVVDDEAPLAELAARILEKSGYRVSRAEDGEAALAVLEACAGALDVILTDQHMPRLDGAGLYHAVQERYPHIKFIFVTGDGQIPASLTAQTGEQPLALCKPYTARKLREAVQQALNG